jgi:hypothetical protein
MKIKQILSIVLLLLISGTTFSQIKIKGDKNIVTRERTVPFFDRIEIIDDIEVYMGYSATPSVAVETDSNVQEYILTEVSNGVLSIKIDDVIVRNKTLAVHLKVNEELKEIYAYNNAKISGKNLIEIDSFTVNGFDNASFDLKLRSKQVLIKGKKSSKVQLEVLCDDFTMRLEESADVKGVIDTKTAIVELLDRSGAGISGSADALELQVSGNSSFKGRTFVAKDVNVQTSNNADAYINTKSELDIYARNASKVYIYNDAKITLHEFFDKATLFKKN